MHPKIRRDLARFSQLDHVHGRRVAPLHARPAFQCAAVQWPKFRAGSIDTRLPRPGHDLHTFQIQIPTRSTSDAGSTMPTVKVRASTILREFEQAQTELVGKAVILTDGKAGTVEEVAYLHHQIHAAGLKSDLDCGEWFSYDRDCSRKNDQETLALSSPIIFVRMHSNIRRYLARFRYLNHMQRRRVAAPLARSAFQRRFKLPDRRCPLPAALLAHADALVRRRH
jgi:hypothetical protein